MSFSIDGISSLVSNAQNSAAAGSASALKNSISSVSSGSSEEELLSVCKDFESYFVEEVLKENLISDDDEDKDSSLSTLTDFHMDSTIELVADEIVDQVGESYTQQLYEQMKRNYGIE